MTDTTKKALYIIIPVSVIVILFLFMSSRGKQLGRRYKRKPQGISSTQGSIYGNTRGLRNNNPGNVEPVQGDTWIGQTGNDGRFAIFEDMEYGARAMIRILQTYNKKHGLNTIKKILNRYAPTRENNTSAYINTVSSRTSIAPNMPLNFDDMQQISKIAQAMAYVEIGAELPINIFLTGYILEKTV